MSNDKRAEYTAAVERFKRASLAEQRRYLTERLKFDPESICTPAAQIETRRQLWMEEVNPIRVWEAIVICNKHGFPFPPWISAYVDDCASRMTAPDATRGDLRKALPKIVGFNMKPGANLLSPNGHDHDDDDLLALRFAIEIVALGSTTEDALSNACATLNPVLSTRDSRTLLRRIKKFFGIKSTPRTRAEWEAAIEPWFIEAYLRPRHLPCGLLHDNSRLSCRKRADRLRAYRQLREMVRSRARAAGLAWGKRPNPEHGGRPCGGRRTHQHR